MNKTREYKSFLPIGIVTFKTRWSLFKSIVRLGIGVLLGDDWSNNLAKDKEVQVCFTIKKEQNA